MIHELQTMFVLQLVELVGSLTGGVFKTILVHFGDGFSDAFLRRKTIIHS